MICSSFSMMLAAFIAPKNLFQFHRVFPARRRPSSILLWLLQCTRHRSSTCTTCNIPRGRDVRVAACVARLCTCYYCTLCLLCKTTTTTTVCRRQAQTESKLLWLRTLAQSKHNSAIAVYQQQKQRL